MNLAMICFVTMVNVNGGLVTFNLNNITTINGKHSITTIRTNDGLAQLVKGNQADTLKRIQNLAICVK